MCHFFFQGHTRGVYPLIFIPAEDSGTLDEEGLNIHPGDLLITGSSDATARAWSFDTGGCLKVRHGSGCGDDIIEARGLDQL